MARPRTCIVVGCAGRIGSAICSRLAAEGYGIVVADRDVDAGSRLASALGARHAFEQLDVTDEALIADVFDRIESRRPAAVLVVLAGGSLIAAGSRAALASTSLAEWRRSIDLNITGTLLCVRKFAEQRACTLLEDMRIVTCGSLSGQLGGLPTGIAYATAKAA